jgi:8-oxo-dGTP diphosphatase
MRPFPYVVRITSTALLVDRGRILLGRRTSRVRFAGMWDAFGGHLERGETPGQALRRELREELGIEVTLAEFVRIYEDVDPTSGETFQHHLFVVRGWDGDPGIANEEHSEIRWFRPEETAELNLMPSIKQAIATAVAEKA